MKGLEKKFVRNDKIYEKTSRPMQMLQIFMHPLGGKKQLAPLHPKMFTHFLIQQHYEHSSADPSSKQMAALATMML